MTSSDAQQGVLPAVMRVCDIELRELATLVAAYQMKLCVVDADAAIPGSYWGETEAGLVGRNLFAQHQTPVHSVLHEGAHYICMDSSRRATLHTDANGDHAEENAVCYLQILLADRLPGYDRARMIQDMDSWGYTFRLGGALAWFEQDAQDAREWLINAGVIDTGGRPTGRMRQ